MSPPVSISCCFDYAIPIDRQLPMVAGVGFTHVSLSRADHAGYLGAGRTELARRIADCGLAVDTIHGPTLTNDDAVETTTATLDAAAALGAHSVVVHPTPFEIGEDERAPLLEVLRPRVRTIARHARAAGVTIALENLCPGPTTEVVRTLLSESDHDSVGFCYDSSHDQIDGPRPPDLLAEWSSRTTAVHLSDRSAPFVDHLPPGEGFIDFSEICGLLRTGGFDKPVLLEVMSRHTAVRTAPELLAAAYRAAIQLHALIRGSPAGTSCGS